MTLLEEYCICTRCGKNHTDGVHKLCDACREKSRHYWKNHKDIARAAHRRAYLKFIAESRCPLCGKPATHGVLCERHWLYNKAQNDRRPRKGYREQGLCLKCGAERADGYKLCPKCLEAIRETQKKGVKAANDRRNNQATP